MSTWSSLQSSPNLGLKAVRTVWLLVLFLSLWIYMTYPSKKHEVWDALILPQPPLISAHTSYPAWPPTHEMISAIADEQGRVIVVGVNFGYLDMFYNWARSAVNVGLTNIVIVALDNETYEVLKKRFPERTLLPSFKVEGGFAEFGTVEFRQLTRTRPSFIRAIVDLGFPVLYTDTDTIMRRNPFNDIEDGFKQQPKTNVMVSEDGAPGYFCSCMLYFSCDEPSRALLKAWETECRNAPEHDDQHALNVAITEHSLLERVHVFVIPESIFPSGKRTFVQGYDWYRFPHGPSIVHANYMVGHDTKMRVLNNPAGWDRPFFLPILYDDTHLTKFH